MSVNISQSRRRIAAVAFAGAVLSSCGFTLEARAMDDGEAPIWTGLSGIVGPLVGVTNKDDKAAIEYRERSKLVVPPKMDLPKPGAGPAKVAMPVDQDVQHAKKMKALEDDQRSSLPVGRITDPIVKPGAVVTMSATAGAGPSGGACLKDGVQVACPAEPKKSGSNGASMNWNPLTWVGIQKKPDVVLGPEPDRDFLTDPPSGYRAPVEGVGAKIKSD